MIRKLTNQAIGKEVDARMRTIHRHPFCAKVMKTFGFEIFHRTSLIHTGFMEFFEDVYKDSGGYKGRKHVAVEIGTWNGLTSAFMAQFFRKVITCDIVDEKPKYEVWKKLGVKNIEFVKVDSERDKEKKMMALEYHFAYLDGDHRKPDVDWLILNKCKTGLIHEAWEVAPENAIRVASHPNHRLFGFNFAYVGPDLSIDGETKRRERLEWHKWKQNKRTLANLEQTVKEQKEEIDRLRSGRR